VKAAPPASAIAGVIPLVSGTGLAATTVSATVVDAVSAPEAPLIVTVTEPPSVAELVAVSVSTLEPVVVGLGLNEAVIPLGRPVADSVTPPVNPYAGVTVMVSVLLLP